MFNFVEKTDGYEESNEIDGRLVGRVDGYDYGGRAVCGMFVAFGGDA